MCTNAVDSMLLHFSCNFSQVFLIFVNVWNRLLSTEYNKSFSNMLDNKASKTAQETKRYSPTSQWSLCSKHYWARLLSWLSAEGIQLEYGMMKACLCTLQSTILKAFCYELLNKIFINLLFSIHIHPKVQSLILGYSHLPTYAEV